MNRAAIRRDVPLARLRFNTDLLFGTNPIFSSERTSDTSLQVRRCLSSGLPTGHVAKDHR